MPLELLFELRVKWRLTVNRKKRQITQLMSLLLIHLVRTQIVPKN